MKGDMILGTKDSASYSSVLLYMQSFLVASFREGVVQRRSSSQFKFLRKGRREGGAEYNSCEVPVFAVAS